jgi:hypothetical protein
LNRKPPNPLKGEFLISIFEALIFLKKIEALFFWALPAAGPSVHTRTGALGAGRYPLLSLTQLSKLGLSRFFGLFGFDLRAVILD